jgi:hypothetical protein
MLLQGDCNKFGLPFTLQTREPNEQDSGVKLVLTKYEFTKVFVGGHERIDFPNEQDIMSIQTEPVNNLLIDILVRNNPRSKAIAARILAAVNRGCSDKIRSTVSPAASFSKISSTVIRVSATVGFPIIILGSELIKASGIGYLGYPQSTTAPLGFTVSINRSRRWNRPESTIAPHRL